MPGGPETEALKALAEHSQSWADWSTLIVFIGLLGEIGITFAYTKDKPRSEIILGIICGVVIAVGVLGELRYGSRAAQANSQLRIISEGQLSDAQGRLRKAEDGLRIAIVKAGGAKASADGAAKAASQANSSAQQAQGAASNALALARGARQEADSFEKDIVSAKKQAADAESHLAEALRRATEATAELDRLKSPRTLTNVPKLVSTLSEFKGTEYTFSAVWADEESVLLLRSINDVLQRAGWKRGKALGGFPAINVFGNDEPFSVPEALNSGIRISVDSPEDISVLKSLPPDKLPMPVRAAVALDIALSSSLSPREDIEHPYLVNLVNVGKAESKTVRISIGKKP
jgi:hypothetical protein